MVELRSRTLRATTSRERAYFHDPGGLTTGEGRPCHGPRVRDAMVKQPTTHDASASIAEIRELFLDEHKHIVLLVEKDRLIGTIERQDLATSDSGDASAGSIGTLHGRTIGPGTSLDEAAAVMQRAARRRLAVIDSRGALLGLLCLKASGTGFCSDQDVRNRLLGFAKSTRTRRSP